MGAKFGLVFPFFFCLQLSAITAEGALDGFLYKVENDNASLLVPFLSAFSD